MSGFKYMRANRSELKGKQNDNDDGTDDDISKRQYRRYCDN